MSGYALVIVLCIGGGS